MKTIQFELLTSLEDGTPVSLNKYEIGGVIQLVDADGNKSSAPDGDYTFEDGSIATVTGGTITAIAPAPDDETAESYLLTLQQLQKKRQQKILLMIQTYQAR